MYSFNSFNNPYQGHEQIMCIAGSKLLELDKSTIVCPRHRVASVTGKTLIHIDHVVLVVERVLIQSQRRVTEKFQPTGSFSVTDLRVQGLSAGLVDVEEISGLQKHVHILRPSDTHNFVKPLPKQDPARCIPHGYLWLWESVLCLDRLLPLRQWLYRGWLSRVVYYISTVKYGWYVTLLESRELYLRAPPRIKLSAYIQRNRSRGQYILYL
ncbi:uncharacterized protein YALI1_E41737g [Yarrowia lipolytica]|uniref:Uncharacterized protein n=1 Tax=Yarrowia lipolytica TaxID=4952 RepID=A0A1D8NLB2_YARLL|nr:hypothetical protein YALI1_E41737g [Yarrowia lipolytica]